MFLPDGRRLAFGDCAVLPAPDRRLIMAGNLTEKDWPVVLPVGPLEYHGGHRVDPEVLARSWP